MKNVKILSLVFAISILLSLCALPVCAAAEDAGEGFTFEPMNFVSNLYYMGVGMFCIIVVIGVLIGVTMILNKVTAPKNKE